MKTIQNDQNLNRIVLYSNKKPSMRGFFLCIVVYVLKLAQVFSPALMALFKISLICSVVILPPAPFAATGSPTILILIDTDFLSSHRFLPA